MDKVVMYTDGSCIGNPGPGGFGAVINFNNKGYIELSGGEAETTNNRMELTAVLMGLEKVNCSSSIIIYTDSKYVVDAVNKNWLNKWHSNSWRKSDGGYVRNRDLWLRLLSSLHKHQVTFMWVKGHNGLKENERCDELARHESSKYLH